MKAMFDFHCDDCGTGTERFISADVRSIKCECGGTMKRLISTPTVVLEGITGAFPGAHDKWARIREQNARIKARKNS